MATSPPDLADVLARLGLADYHHILVENGFHSWETVVDITEDDLTALHFKLGHRRALQREIATSRGVPASLSLDLDSSAPEPTSLSSTALETLAGQASPPPPREKRRYRRHPRPDFNAPKKPKTAYVNFADQLRTDPNVSQLSFVNIAREVGRRWQELPAEQKRVWESNAARAMQEFEAQMDDYKKTDHWRRYQLYLNDFRAQQAASASGKRPANSRSTTDTSNNTRYLSRASPSSADSSTSLPSNPSMGTEAEACHNALSLAFSELVTLRGEVLNQGCRPFDEHHLPSEELLRRAMYAFIRGTGSLLYMWTFEQADEILNRIYRPQQPVDAMTLAEGFTVAAMGAYYDMDCFPDRIRRSLYASGTLHFHEQMARRDCLRTMRLLLSVSFYALLEKHLSARYLIAAGLHIGRWKCGPKHMLPGNLADDGWRKIFRSLIFMDCWLSYTLGYASEVTPTDVQIAGSLRTDMVTIDELIHVQMSKIGLIAAEIAKTLASPEVATRENITVLAQKLEHWRMGVPLLMQIPTLTSNNSPDMTSFQRRAILMVHIMYLGAVVLLYRQLLVATAERQLTDGAAVAAISADFAVSEARSYRNECATAAQQIARMLNLIHFDGTLTKRCWLIIYWAFSAAVVLLFSATTKLIDGEPHGLDADLNYAQGCIDILERCRDFEPIAARFFDTLWPSYSALRNVHQRMVGRSKTSIFALLQADPGQLGPPILVSKQEMGPISDKLSTLLTDPFGRKQGLSDDGSMRRLLNDDGSCSVFWWR